MVVIFSKAIEVEFRHIVGSQNSNRCIDRSGQRVVNPPGITLSIRIKDGLNALFNQVGGKHGTFVAYRHINVRNALSQPLNALGNQSGIEVRGHGLGDDLGQRHHALTPSCGHDQGILNRLGWLGHLN